MVTDFIGQTPGYVKQKHLLFVLNLLLATFTAFVFLGLLCSTSMYHWVSEETLRSPRLTVPTATSLTTSLLNNSMDYFPIGLCGFFFTGLLTPYDFLFKPPLEAKFLQEFKLLNFIETLLTTLYFPR